MKQVAAGDGKEVKVEKRSLLPVGSDKAASQVATTESGELAQEGAYCQR